MFRAALCCYIKKAIFKLCFAFVSKRVFVQNHPYGNVFGLHVYLGHKVTRKSLLTHSR